MVALAVSGVVVGKCSGAVAAYPQRNPTHRARERVDSLPRATLTMIGGWHPYWQWGGASALGKRDEQQDRWGVWVTPDKRALLAVVADGMGGRRPAPCSGASRYR
ncbi:MAG: PP2C family serine/threonine-protein phosphatase [Candidatus Competibacteraceae bacterium]